MTSFLALNEGAKVRMMFHITIKVFHENDTAKGDRR